MSKPFEQPEGGGRKKGLFRFEAAAASEKSKQHMKNQDAVLVETENGLFGVFDGVGGYAGGEIASRIARDTVRSEMKGFRADTIERAMALVEAAILEAHRKVREDGKPKSGTTADVVQMWHGLDTSAHAIIGHSGDGRVCRYSKGGNLERFTIDHTPLVLSADNPGALLDRFDAAKDANDLTEDEQEINETRSVITQMLGQDEKEGKLSPTLLSVEVYPDDRLVLMSDGVHDNLTTSEIETILAAHASSQDAARELVRAAKARSTENHFRSKDDDMSAVVININK